MVNKIIPQRQTRNYSKPNLDFIIYISSALNLSAAPSAGKFPLPPFTKNRSALQQPDSRLQRTIQSYILISQSFCYNSRNLSNINLCHLFVCFPQPFPRPGKNIKNTLGSTRSRLIRESLWAW